MDRGVALHYGDPLGEQRALISEVAMVDFSHRPMLAVWGDDRLPWLDSLTSQRLADLPPYRWTQALVLSAEGYIRHHLYVTEFGDYTWLSLEPGKVSPLLTYLRSMLFLVRADVHEVVEWGVLAMAGPEVARVLAEFGVSARAASPSVMSLAGGGWLWQLQLPHGFMSALVVPRGQVGQVTRRLLNAGVRLAGIEAYEALRVASGRPRLRFEIDDHTFPAEVGHMRDAVSLDKGPFPGREAVERTAQHPPRRLMRLRLDVPAPELPPHGASVLLAGRQVGFVGTAAYHVEQGPLALTLVESDVPDDAALSVQDVPAVIDPAPAAR